MPGQALRVVLLLVRDQGVGGSNPLSPTNFFCNLAPAPDSIRELFCRCLCRNRDRGPLPWAVSKAANQKGLRIPPLPLFLSHTSTWMPRINGEDPLASFALSRIGLRCCGHCAPDRGTLRRNGVSARMFTLTCAFSYHQKPMPRRCSPSTSSA